MPSLTVGIYCEGTDWMILNAFLCRILDRDPSDVEVISRFTRGGGFKHLTGALPNFLHEFYNLCVTVVIVHADNDGKTDLTRPGAPSEDPKHPRHANHPGKHVDECRYCMLVEKIEQTRPGLRYLPAKDGMKWPVVVAVPVEAIESWLLTAEALAPGGTGNLRAEDLPGGMGLKMALYKRPIVTTQDVQSRAVPLVQNPDLDLDRLAAYSPSFKLFRDSVKTLNIP